MATETKHQLKCWVNHFDAIRLGSKTFDVRRDDRNYKIGDVAVLCELRHMVGKFTGRKLERRIAFILRPGKPGEADGIAPGYCVLGYSQP